MLVNQLTERNAHRDFIVSRALDMPADTKNARARALWWRTDGPKPFRSPIDDVRQIRERFHVIDHSRLVIESMRGGKRRLDARQAAFAFQRFEQCSFFPAYIGAGSPMHPDLNREAGSLDVFTDVACPAGLADRLLQDPGSQDKLASYINVRRLGSDRVTGQDDPFQDLVGVALDQLAVLERPGLTFIGVAAEIAGALVILGQESPFNAGGKAGTAAAAKAGFDDQLRHVGGRDLSEDLLERLVAARLFILGQRSGIPRLTHILEQNRFVL